MRQLIRPALLSVALSIGVSHTAIASAQTVVAANAATPTPADPAAAPAAAPLSVAPLAYEYRELANGLRVYAMPDASTANVSVQVWYDVGSKDDPAGRSGFAHLFEHIMFKATRNMPSETFDRLTEDVGGFNNASTADDYTNYYEVVPAHHLERILWAEAERMGSLVIDEATFNSERDVVKEELRQRVLASPYGPLFYLNLAQANYQHHPYGRPGIGSIADLDAATVADVRGFHATYYRPDNAVLVVSGNFDTAQLNRWVDQYFGPLARPSRPIPRVDAVEPLRTQPRAYDVYQANVPLPAVTISWPQPAASDPDVAALQVLDGILTTGNSSRVYQSMVQDATIASEVFGLIDITPDPGAYSIGAVLSDGVTVEAGEAAIRAQVARIRDGLVTAAELDEAKNELIVGQLRSRETAEGRAEALADAVIRYGDAAAADRQLAAIQAVTAADVQRVARRILDDSRTVTIRYRPAESRAAGARADTIATATTIAARPLTIPASEIPVYTLADAAARVAPPAPGTAISPVIPAVGEHRLANGMRVLIARNARVPLVSVNLLIGAGDSADDAAHAGLAEMTATLLPKGTTTRDASAIARAIESLGADLGAATTADASSVSLLSRADRIDDAMAVMADVVLHPTFAEDELVNARQQALDGLQVALSEPGSVASLATVRSLYGLSPYGRFRTPTTLAAIDRAGVAAFYGRVWRPDNAVVVITGDVTDAAGLALAQRHFGGWARPSTPLPAATAASSFATTARTLVVDMPDAGQAAVTMALPGIARRDPDYFPALVTNSVVGGGYSARLNAEIRIRRGLSYGAGSSMIARLNPGSITASAQTRNDAVVQVADLMRGELARLGSEPVSDGELTARKAGLIGGFGREIETVSGLSSQIARLALYGLPPQSLETYIANVGAVGSADVQRIGQRLFNPANAQLVIVGNASIFFDGVAAARPGAQRLPVDQIDLDSATLAR